jgi:hypothetical protein
MGQSVGGASAPYTVGGTPTVGTTLQAISGSTVATINVLDPVFVHIAKPAKMRANVIYAETIAGVAHTYSYARDSSDTVAGRWIRTNNWTDVGGAETETEVITPDYLDGDIIYAINFTFAGSPADLTGLTLLDLNVDGRAWNVGP